MGSYRLSSFAKVHRGSFMHAISSARKCARKQGRGVYAVRRLAIHDKNALIFREIASWARRVGIRIVTFEACSGFTRVTARRIAQPPKATFVTRLQSHQSPSEPARQLLDLSTIIQVDP